MFLVFLMAICLVQAYPYYPRPYPYYSYYDYGVVAELLHGLLGGI